MVQFRKVLPLLFVLGGVLAIAIAISYGHVRVGGTFPLPQGTSVREARLESAKPTSLKGQQPPPSVRKSVEVTPLEESQPSLSDLLKTYVDLGLPLPPKDTPLVRFENGERGGIYLGKRIPPFALGFLLRPARDGKPPLLLLGTEKVEPLHKLRNIEIQEKPEASLVKDVHPTYGLPEFEINNGLATALQCKARGWDGLAQSLWNKSVRMDMRYPWHRRNDMFQKPNPPDMSALYYMAWVHWLTELVKPATDRAAIAERMADLLEIEPNLDNEANKHLLRCLRLALVPGNAQPGTIDAMIDDLVNYNGVASVTRWVGRGEGYERIARFGLEAVPFLIEHLNDERLTRAQMLGFGNFPTWIMSVQDVVSDLLEDISGHQLERGWFGRQRGEVIDRKAAEAWWEKARTGERKK